MDLWRGSHAWPTQQTFMTKQPAQHTRAEQGMFSFSKTFNTVLHNTFLNKLRKYKLDKRTVWGTVKWLNYCSQRTVVNDTHTSWTLVTKHGRWELILGPSEIQEISLKHKKTFFFFLFYWSLSTAATSNLDKLQTLHPWRYLKSDWTQSCFWQLKQGMW